MFVVFVFVFVFVDEYKFLFYLVQFFLQKLKQKI